MFITPSSIRLEQRRVKQEIALKTYIGISNFAAISDVQGRALLVIKQLGGGFNSDISFSKGRWSKELAVKKSVTWSGEVRESRFSMLSGKPASEHGKWRGMRRISKPELVARSMRGWKRAAFNGVVMMVTVRSRWWVARSLAKSVMGIRWLWDMRGTMRKWRWWWWWWIWVAMGGDIEQMN
ncbi:hypothetical protein RHGRI_007151 [Rhododendron griersonianum]|uniref:Uncharacterized protein n=1 Tax=Rhododendron griersonianum TaxID=479676 RepID=A0AAV6KVY9_9ERIC|nr:hypothetical protein RHGRI_007151 [Rhododendron griersonianum]